MRKRRLLLATSALATAISCGRDKKPVVYANPKGSHYDDAGVQPSDAMPPPGDGGAPADAEVIGPPANPKGSFYDQGLAPKPGKQ
jgi:hypothetical protein